MNSNRRGEHRSERDSWRSLQLFLTYRIAVSALILVLHLFNLIPGIPQFDSITFFQLAVGLLTINVVLLPVSLLKLLAFRPLVIAMVTIDIVVLALMMRASIGIDSGLGMLMLPSIAGASLLLPGNLAPAFAALGTLAIFFEIGHGFLIGRYSPSTLTLGGIQGALFFGVSILAAKTARRAKASEALARERGRNLADLSEINHYIVEQMDEGILVINEQARIQACNDAAKRILGKPDLVTGMSLSRASKELTTAYDNWCEASQNQTTTYSPDNANGVDFELRFVQPINDTGTLVFLQNISERSRKMQELKLAALGRLTASIAHEIRNPLGAISHAGQLLSESHELNDADTRLVQIVSNNSERMNNLVENVLNLSRRKETHPESLHLQNWLEEIVSEFRERYELSEQQLSLSLSADQQPANADPAQLHQVIWNLLRNAQAHAIPEGELEIQISGGISEESQQTWLDVIDNGSGIETSIEDQLFEPFFTTGTSGTGLGLYLAKELCEGNGGSLEYLRPEQGGSCFRIKLPLAA